MVTIVGLNTSLLVVGKGNYIAVTVVESFHCNVTTFCTELPSHTPSHSTPPLPVSPSVEEMQTFYNEVAILKKVSRRGNPHVITMVGFIARENPPAIVMEFAPLGSLRDFLVKVKEEVRSCMSNKCTSSCVYQFVLLWSSCSVSQH